MSGWPSNRADFARLFRGRQGAIREKLRWVPPRSKRRQKLEAELAAIVREELQRETGALPPEDDEPELKLQWWQK